MSFRKYNQDLADEEKLQIRIGMHIGEITQRGSDIFGMGVNISSRLEQLAVPGEIFLSETLLNEIQKLMALNREGKYGSYFYLFRGRLKLLQGNITEAIKELDTGANYPAAPPTVHHRAVLYLNICKDRETPSDEYLANMKKAIEELEKIASYPELTEALRIFGMFMIKGDRPDTARPYLSRGIELAEESDMKWEMDWMKELLGEIGG